VAPASTRLRVAALAGRSVVTDATSRTPLRLLVPRNHGHAAWVYQSSHGGGLVGRDDVTVYSGADARTRLDARVGDRAVLVAWPDPLVCFGGSSYVQQQRFALEPTASLVCIDAYGAGRVERGERWAFRRLSLELEVTIAGTRALRDALLLDPTHGNLGERLAPFDAYATIVLAGPQIVDALDALEDATAPSLERVLVTLSRTTWGGVARIGARDVQTLSGTLRSLLGRPVTRLLGDDPWKRKW
jgi:urease accessory protein